MTESKVPDKGASGDNKFQVFNSCRFVRGHCDANAYKMA